ncbi:hypothetical protein WJX72_000671 [[Myrmecia] bisecta]|uniref:Protein kinase domain-containing protein n=1 Tax=[Myrmecia] bisecta TaxID=41462 RepID=A0AAW1PN89_9CHLO
MGDRNGLTRGSTPGTFFVDGRTWKVGERYDLQKLLGSGSFSSVCLAVDTVTDEQVAIKKIPDVLSSPEQARRTLREICIMRRLSHPFIIGFRDAFVRPAANGPCRYVGGQLIPKSIDVYIIMEFADGGDIFNYRGQMAAEETKLLMWQMTHALKYLHSNDVWHRDLKSANVLLTREQGHRIVKIADFGSARSAKQEGYHWAEQDPPTPTHASLTGPATLHSMQSDNLQKQVRRSVAGAPPLHSRRSQSEVPHVSSFERCSDMLVQKSDLYVQVGSDMSHRGSGLRTPLTRMVATPCYRAPEVVMSRGGYGSAIDMWSLGCIFGELLQRIARVGSATTPHLQVAPLFAIHGMPKTPDLGETFRDQRAPGNSTTRKELQALFDVVGTPAWADVDNVQSPEWRHYLQKLPGKAPSLYRRLGVAGEVTVHLLSRLLAFDPARRISAEEALAHEYFAEFESPADSGAAASSQAGDVHDMQVDGLKRARSASDGDTISDLKSELAAAEEQAAKRAKNAQALEQRLASVAIGNGSQGAQDGNENVTMVDADQQQQLQHHYYEEADATRALAMLEEEMADISTSDGETAELDTIRRLLERECAQVLAPQPSVRGVRLDTARGWSATGESGSPRGSAAVLKHWAADIGLLEDRAGPGTHARNEADYGRERLAFVADARKARLDPAEHLTPNRHWEWTEDSGLGPPAGPTWGVTRLPPGIDPLTTDPKVLESIRRQQLR